MTNGEKLQTILDIDRDCTKVHGENGTMTFTVTQDFWNAEYKEPTTKNDLAVDCVSRQEVDRLSRIYLKEPTDNHVAFYEDFLDLPPVTPQEPRWIPVSEKLPEPFTFVNATCRSLVDDRENWVIETIYLPIPKEVNKYGYSDWGNIPMLNLGEAEVIAWVERIIPQPYKLESEPQESENKE